MHMNVEKRGIERVAYHALIGVRKGETDEVRHAARETARTGDVPVHTARLFAAAGDAASALQWLQEADGRHDFGARMFARYAPDFDRARSSEYAAPAIAGRAVLP